MANLGMLGLVGVLLYFAAKTIRRLYFHPLSNFPGPKLAAATSAYEGYFNVVKNGMFIWELERLHNVYGETRRKNRRNVALTIFFRSYCPYIAK